MKLLSCKLGALLQSGNGPLFMDLKTKGYCCDRCGNYIAHDMAATEEEQERETGRTKIKYQAMIARKTEYHWQGTNYSGTRFLCLSCTRAFLSFYAGHVTPLFAAVSSPKN